MNESVAETPRTKKLTGSERENTCGAPLVLALGVNGLRQEIVVEEGEEFRVVTEVGHKRWTLSGQVGQIVEGVVAVDLTVEADDVATKVTDGEMHSQLKLRVNEYLGVSHGGRTIIVRSPWIRRGLDRVLVLAQSLTKRNAGFYAALTYLGQLGPAAKKAVPGLIDVLKKENESLHDEDYNTAHHMAAEALGKIGTEAKPAVPELLKLLKASNGHVRVAAALSLWRIAKHPQAIPVLNEALKDRNKFVRIAAAEAQRVIAEDGSDAAVPASSDSIPAPPDRG